MAQIQTVNFLPEAFRTPTNQKFLNATLDQLVTQPDLRNINGYIGRKFAPTFKSTDNYVPESTVQRQNYQLEPSVVVTDPITNKIDFFSSYIDLVNQIDHDGGFTNNHTRLFENEYYSFDGLFDFDKFINFSQYYWLEDGPDPVQLYGSQVPVQETYIVTRDTSSGSYKFSTEAGVENPQLRLAYGGTYQFVVNQPGFPFWIQSFPGLSGLRPNQTNLTSRDVLGVTNNGTDVGTVTFNVPQANAQDFYVRMPLAGTANLSTTLSYNQIHGQRLSSIIASQENGIDGVRAYNQLSGKALIFVGGQLDDAFWTPISNWNVDTNGNFLSIIDETQVVPVANRLNAWNLSLSSDADPIVTLNPIAQAFTVGALQKVFVTSGTTRAEYSYYLAPDYLQNNVYNIMPDITAPLNIIYYQDGMGESYAGQFNLLEVTDTTLDVDTGIVGAKTYTSPNGVALTNGLKVTFDSTANPSTYSGNTYYVEGVGTAIQLIPTTSFITPESYATNGLGNLDYITINRASADLNPWTRSNRWFHIDVINATSTYNNTTPMLDQNLRASRPIIEFESNLQLYNFGRVAKVPVDLLDFTINDSRNNVELQASGYTISGTTLTQGMRIVFANDYDPTVRNQIFVVNIVNIPSLYPGPTLVINLVPAEDNIIDINNNLVVTQGINKGVEYYYNGSNWIAGQQKTSINQTPMFDVIDANGVSLGDTGVYTNSTFATTKNNLGTTVGGTPIFSYSVGTAGVADPILSFVLTYRNFNQIGDIEFTNNFDNDVFTYGSVTNQNINTVGTLQQNTSLTAYGLRNSWTTNTEQSKQFQIISGIYDGNNPYFTIDISQSTETSVPYFRVYRNSQQISAYELVTVGLITYVKIIDSNLTTGDQIDILIYNNSAVSKLGYYEVPKNLDFNSANKNFTSLTLGQLRNHLTTMVANSNQVIGQVPGDSNLRDTPIKAQGGSILQHASPIMYSELFLEDTNANFLQGLDLARREYSKFKNKVIELSGRTPGLDYTNIPALLDTLLLQINTVKNNTFAWYYSDMVPYGNLKNTITYTVLNVELNDFEISNIFSDNTLSNTAVLVYQNNVQLVKGKDYIFDTTRSGITITAALSIGDVVTINEYSNTDGNYIPETPTKLGLYPKFTPEKIYDTTYQNPVYVIQGHDGSLTPSFGDYRDDLLLELEKRIYNNIKVNYAQNIFDLYNHLPGKFRTTAYSEAEYTQLLTNSFLSWVGDSRVDYITNTYFVASVPFTWNYNNFVDTINGQALPGYWRGIYKHLYDTDRPHTAPWEMLGFSEQPSWWETRYGPAPYTGGNLVLWTDLQNGYIWNNGVPYTDARFARPYMATGLKDSNGVYIYPPFIPVDATGSLVSPNNFIVKSINSNQTSSNFTIGDQGPVETAWRRSSDYPYAVQQALALSNPAFYFGSLIDIGRYYKNTDLNQYVLADSLQRITPGSIRINGTTIGTTTYRSAGYLNWVAEYLRNQGIDPGTYIYNYLDNVQVQLAYKMAGFTDQTFIEVIAEQSSPTSTNSGVVIPNESYKIDLYKSTPTNSITYSGVVIEVTPTGYSVSGFDFDQPYFTIIPSLANNNNFPLNVLNSTAIIYKNYQNYKVTVPYGFEFATQQQVVDFLVSYQRYLRGVGIQLTDQDPDLGVQRDFLLSAQEFLTWAQQGWKTSSVLVLSPILNKFTLVTPAGVVDKIQNAPNQSRVMDTGYNFIKYNQLTVTRTSTVNGNTFTLSANSGQTISLVKVDIVEYEHILVFDNIDIFNDVIYVPELGNRQYRLKLVGKKTGSWTGDMNPPGFIYNSPTVASWQPGTDYPLGSLVSYKNNNYTALQDLVATDKFQTNNWVQLSSTTIKTGLLPNFSYNAEKFNRFNDIDNPETLGDFHLYSDSSIGFRPRDYMTNFGIDEVTQAKFYQGFIREKGTLNAINAFTAAGFNGITSNISLYEEWGIRVGEYGALNNNRYAELILSEGAFNGDPFTFTLLPNNATSSANNIIGVQPSQLYLSSATYTPNIYLNRDRSSVYENDIATAGYVDVNDVSTTLFNIGNYAQLTANIASVGIGYTVWVAKDSSNNWNVFRVTETNLAVTNMTYGVDNIGNVKFNKQHSFAYGDLILVKGFDVRVDGFYQVYSVVDAYTISVVFYGQNADQIKQAMTISGTGPVYKLQSSRIQKTTDINSLTPYQGWMDNDKLWVDSDYTTGGWAVYNKSTPWAGNVSPFNANMKLSGNYTGGVGFGTVTAINNAGTFVVAGIPKLGLGNVVAFVSNISNGHTFTQVANLGAHAGDSVSNFGASLDTAGNLLYIGDPGNGTSDYGRVHIHKFDGNTSFPWTQTLTSPWASNTGDAFGTSVTASTDGTWLYVSAPNNGNVYVYQANSTNYYTYANTITIGSSSYAQFGYRVKSTTDGRQVAISAPYQSVNGITAAGSVYVYDRSVETFIANGGPAYFTTYPIPSSNLRVTLNGNIISTGFTTNTAAINFNTAPVIGSVITVDTNHIQLLEQLTSPSPSSGSSFGLVTWISGNDADVYVASPGYSVAGYHSGIVYRFVNQGASYGTISSTNYTPVITPGNTLRINGVNVAIGGNTVTSVAANINSANIPGVTATVTDYNALTLTSNVSTPYQKLILGPGSGSLLANLGLNVFANVQSFMHPAQDQVNLFGSQVMSTADGRSLIIGAAGGESYSVTTFDADTTLFDYSSTSFIDGVPGTGSVYVYGLVNASFAPNTPDQYTLVQTLHNNNLSINDQFGYSVAMNANTILVGAPGDSNSFTTDPVTGLITPISNAGTYYIYNNFSGNVGWDVVEIQQPQVDIDSIGRLYLYNTATETILTDLDYIDPAKGKILGAAEEDLDFITAYDPAVYNAVGGIDSVPNLAYSLDFHWGADQLTQTWWNTDLVRFMDYEQGNLTYRANNWGRQFPGSTVQVCEWVASSLPPSAYIGSGTPLYPDNSAYCIESYINPVTKLVSSTYYFWVYGKNTLELESTHLNTVSTIQSLITNPQAQGIPYAAVLRNDTIQINGVSNYLSGNTVALHIDYDTLKNTNIIHGEYQLVQEGNSESLIPTRIINKLIDSLSGIDMNGYSVPSANLTPQSSIGLGVNPNQTLFVNRLTALENFVQYVNGVLIQYPIVEDFNITSLYDSAPQPLQSTYDISVNTYAELTYVDTGSFPVGYVALVVNDETTKNLWTTYTWSGSAWNQTSIQSYHTPFYWEFTDWYDSTYDPTVLPTYVVDSITGISTISPVPGDTIKVLNNGNNQFVVYRYNSDGTSSLVGIQNGTIQFLDTLYTTTVAATEIRIIFNAIQNNIFIDELAVNFNDLFFMLVNYILTEQPQVDWIFKTSFVSILHKLRKLNQPANYIPDNQTYYEEYINEVKPYRTSIREYLIDYQGDDEYYGDTTDFDIPATYIANVGAYYSPTGASPADATYLSTLPQYNQWYNNHGYGISEVLVSHPGNAANTAVVTLTTFNNISAVAGSTITQPDSGASGTVFVSAINTNTVTLSNIAGTFLSNVGNIYAGANLTYINVNGANVYSNVSYTTNGYSLSGYFSEPIVTVVGGGGTGANIKAIVDYSTYTISGFEVVNPGSGYTSQPSIVINGTGTGATGYAKLNNHYFIDSLPTTTIVANTNVSVYAGNIITQTNTGAYGTVYANSTGNIITLVDVNGTFASNQYIFNDYSNLHTVVTSTSSFTQFINQSYNTVRSISSTIKFDRITYSSNVVDWTPDLTITANAWVRYNGQAYQAKSTVYSSAILSLSGNISANVGNIITQLNSTGNATISNISSNLSLITVSNVSGTFVRRWGNIKVNGADANVVPTAVTNIFDYTKYTLLNANTFTNAADRVTAYYAPTSSMPGRDLSQLMTGITYPGVNVSGVPFNANTSVTNSNVVYTWSNTSSLYSSNVSVLDFTTLGYAIGQPLRLINDDTHSTYYLTIASIAQDQIVASGVTTIINTGANISLAYYDFNNPAYLDSIIESKFTDTFGANVNNIAVDGGAYYDSFSSHAPEELVPGVTYDSLNMVVTTRLNNNSTPISYRTVHNMTANASSTNSKLWPTYYGISATHSSILTLPLNITDSNIHVVNAAAFTAPSIGLLQPGIVYINGEKITFWTVDTTNNVLGQIRRAVDVTGAPLVHATGSVVVEATITELIPGGNAVHTTTWLNSNTGIGGGSLTITDSAGENIQANVGGVLYDLITSTTAGNAVTDGTGFEGSNTAQAVFLKNLT